VSLPGLNYVVLDANQLTVGPKVERLLAEYRQSGQRIVLPWVHTFEQTKGSADWFDKVHRHLRAEPRAVHLAYPSWIVAHRERKSRRPRTALRHVIDRGNTPFLQYFLADPRPTADISALRATVERMFRLASRPGWPEILVNSVRVDTEAEERAIRKGLQTGDRTALRDSLVGYVRLGRFERAIGHLLATNGTSWRRAAHLVSYPSQNALTLLAYMLLGMRRRYQTPKRESEDNLACDIEAVQIALYGRGLVTQDQLAREMHDDLRLIARELWPAPGGHRRRLRRALDAARRTASTRHSPR
jgi:hypothetical protein